MITRLIYDDLKARLDDALESANIHDSEIRFGTTPERQGEGITRRVTVCIAPSFGDVDSRGDEISQAEIRATWNVSVYLEELATPEYSGMDLFDTVFTAIDGEELLTSDTCVQYIVRSWTREESAPDSVAQYTITLETIYVV